MEVIKNPGIHTEANLSKLAAEWIEGMTQLDAILLGFKEYSRKTVLSDPLLVKQISNNFDLLEPAFLPKLLASIVQWKVLKSQGKNLLPEEAYQALLKGELKFVYSLSSAMNQFAEVFNLSLVEDIKTLKPGDVVWGLARTEENDKDLHIGVRCIHEGDVAKHLLLDLSDEEWLNVLSQTLSEGTQDYFKMSGLGYELQFQHDQGSLSVVNPPMCMRNYYYLNCTYVSGISAWGNILLQLNRVMLTRDTFGGKIRQGLSNFAVQQQVYGLKSSLNVQKELDTPGSIRTYLAFNETFGLHLEFVNNNDVDVQLAETFGAGEPALFQHQGNNVYRGDYARGLMASNIVIDVPDQDKAVRVSLKLRPVDKATKGPNRDALPSRTGCRGQIILDLDDR